MAKAEKIVVELSARDRRLIRELIDAMGIKAQDAPAAEQTIKRLTEPGGVDGEGDWQLNIDEKVGTDD